MMCGNDTCEVKEMATEKNESGGRTTFYNLQEVCENQPMIRRINNFNVNVNVTCVIIYYEYGFLF